MDVRNNTLKNNDKNEIGYSNYGLGFILFESMKKYNTRILQYIADTDETDTQGQALRRSIRTALKLKEKGITKDDIVSSCTHNHKNSIIPFIASLFLGIKTAHFDPSLSHLDTIHLLKLIKPKIIFVDLESLPLMEKCLKESQEKTELVVFGESEKYSNFDEYLEPSIEEDNFRPVVVNNVMETALILFSSGTTGLPKGICLNHYGLIGQFSRNGMRVWGNTGGSVLLQYTTLYWISAVSMTLKSIAEGCARVVCKQFDPAATWRLIEKYKIVDPVTEKTLAANERGEFRYKTAYQMNGYHKIDSSSAYDSEGFIKSGDIAYYDEEDCFFIVDRIKEMFKYKGWHILPAVLEGILLTHPAVKEAAVIGIPHDLDGDHPMGIVALNKGYQNVTPEDLEVYVRERVSDNQRLRAGVKIVEEVKKTTTGKIRRNDMKQMVLNGDI
ncbi:luciferin 4-monooxygenase-like isoform X8 [Anoplophora glabripennis]|uniref:luciferin 4-monooxygenase-like isoform X8 n=1 Tax=Anoplophora glabripennis TaxID=217634 RepID=UPI000C7780FD|nr:luciferin 4-monooxygenase-like isoform X8 [Anoplophora glabripennis]